MNWEKVVEELKVKRDELDTAIRTITELFLTTETVKTPVANRAYDQWKALRGSNKASNNGRHIGKAFTKAAIDVLQQAGRPMRASEVAAEVGVAPTKPLPYLRAAAREGLIKSRKTGKARTAPVLFSAKEVKEG